MQIVVKEGPQVNKGARVNLRLNGLGDAELKRTDGGQVGVTRLLRTVDLRHIPQALNCPSY